ncbi:argonaute family member [Pseudohyphozyma bogoriensis]|nr:argonaute family member [Pseudohyphozyma bogoriensis]
MPRNTSDKVDIVKLPYSHPRRQDYLKDPKLCKSRPAPLILARRRKEGKPMIGSRGKKVKVHTNLYELTLRGHEKSLFRYKVEMMILRSDLRSDLENLVEVPDVQKHDVWHEFERINWEKRRFKDIVLIFDGLRTAYTTHELSPEVLKTMYGFPFRDQSIRISLSSRGREGLDEVTLFSRGEGILLNPEHDTLSALCLLFGSPTHLMPTDRESEATSFPLRPDRIGLLDEHQPLKLNKGLELRRGFHVVAKAYRERLYIGVDLVSAPFLRNGTIAALLRAIGELDASTDKVDPLLRRVVEELLQDVAIEIRFGKDVRPRFATFRCFVNESAKEAIVGSEKEKEKGKGKGKEKKKEATLQVRVFEYLMEKHSLELEFPDFLCVKTDDGELLPPEICTILPGHRFVGNLSVGEQQLAASYETDVQPMRYQQAVESIVKSFTKGERAINYLTELRVKAVGPNPRNDPSHNPGFDPKRPHKPEDKNPLVVEARILRPPSLQYSNLTTVDSFNGSWAVKEDPEPLSFHECFVPATIKSLVAIVDSDWDLESGSKAFEGFMKTFLEFLLKMGESRIKTVGAKSPLLVERMPGETVPRVLDRAVEAGKGRYGAEPKIVFMMFHKDPSPSYSLFKTHGLERGVVTQAVALSNVKEKPDAQFLLHLAWKVNAKLGGINYTLAPRTTSGMTGAYYAPDVEGWLDTHTAMIFGCHILHTEGKPSIAAVCSSVSVATRVNENDRGVHRLSDEGMRCDAEVAVQRVYGPTPPDGSPPKRIEIIENLGALVLKLLFRYAFTQQQLPPTELIFYRSTTSDTELRKVADLEYRSLADAFERFRGMGNQEFIPWRPRVTFISASDTHVRFFGSSQNRSSVGPLKNIPAGTVVDTSIMDSELTDWYSASHSVEAGLTKPTRYVLVADEYPMSQVDDLQTLTNALCYTHQCINHSTHIPAPLIYAETLSERARDWIPAHERFATIESAAEGAVDRDQMIWESVFDKMEGAREKLFQNLQPEVEGHEQYINRETRFPMWWL